MQEQGSLKLEATADQRTPLRQAVSALVGLRGISYSDAYKMVHQWFGVSAIDLLRKYPEDLQFPNEIRKPNPKKRQGIQTAHRCNARPFS